MYCNPRDINDATYRYVEIIRQGLCQAGLNDLGVTNNDSLARRADILVTISCLFAARAFLLHSRANLIHWFQGIEAIERRFIHGGLKGLIQYLIWSAIERRLLRRARLKLFVSSEMRNFLNDVSGPRNRSIVMPCYNTSLKKTLSGRSDRYRHLNLVYAGSMSSWQCVEDVLLTFKELRNRRPEARLTLFTREIEAAREMCNAVNLSGVRIESVSPEQLLNALSEFSYGFILRDHMPINEVSTPTKFSTYLAAGVIPVLTTATPALVQMLDGVPYKVITVGPNEHERVVDALLALVVSDMSVKNVQHAFDQVFDRYFDDDVHATRIACAVMEELC